MPARRTKHDPPGREARRVRTKKQKLVQFRAASLYDQLTARETPIAEPVSMIARRDLERYYGLLAFAVRPIQLTQEDLRRLARCTRGLDYQRIESVQKVPGVVATYVGANDPLSVKVRGLSVTELYAVIDAVERWRIKPRGPNDAEQLDEVTGHGGNSSPGRIRASVSGRSSE